MRHRTWAPQCGRSQSRTATCCRRARERSCRSCAATGSTTAASSSGCRTSPWVPWPWRTASFVCRKCQRSDRRPWMASLRRPSILTLSKCVAYCEGVSVRAFLWVCACVRARCVGRLCRSVMERYPLPQPCSFMCPGRAPAPTIQNLPVRIWCVNKESYGHMRFPLLLAVPSFASSSFPVAHRPPRLPFLLRLLLQLPVSAGPFSTLSPPSPLPPKRPRSSEVCAQNKRASTWSLDTIFASGFLQTL